MSLFGKKSKEEAPCCKVGGAEQNAHAAQAEEVPGSGVKILGSGCAKCNALEAAAKEALLKLGMDDVIDHVTDFSQIAAYGVMSTPALVVDGKVLSYGRVLSSDEVAALLQKARGIDV